MEKRLTALVLTPLWRGGKKNASTEGPVACRLIEQKRSGLKQNTLLIEGFKAGPSLCLFVKKLELTSSPASWPNFHHGNYSYFRSGSTVFYIYFYKKVGYARYPCHKEKKKTVFCAFNAHQYSVPS